MIDQRRAQTKLEKPHYDIIKNTEVKTTPQHLSLKYDFLNEKRALKRLDRNLRSDQVSNGSNSRSRSIKRADSLGEV